MSRTERTLSEQELSPLVSILARKFVQRWDMYPRQYDNDRPYYTVYELLHVGLLSSHLQGELTLGTYALNADSQARFLVLDADDASQWDQLESLACQLQTEGCQSYLERSRRGGHLWLFFDDWLPGAEIRQFGQGLITAHDLDAMELFPKQDVLQDGPGSLVRMPFGVHQATGKRYGFYTPGGRPLAPTLRLQLHMLGTAVTVPKRLFAQYRDIVPQPRQKPVFERVEMQGAQVSDRVKAAISVHEFVDRFVVLNGAGRGFCPFHEDKHRSFSVNTDKNYWSCFAGCGGGSVIDFWMKHQECDFTTAITELADMLLK